MKPSYKPNEQLLPDCSLLVFKNLFLKSTFKIRDKKKEKKVRKRKSNRAFKGFI